MKATIYGAFEDPEHAEKAAGALMDHGLHDYDLTLLIHQRDLEEDDPQKIRVQNEIDANEIGNPNGGYAYADTPGRFVKGPQDGLIIPGETEAHTELMAGGDQPDKTTYQVPPRYISPNEGDQLQRVNLTAKSGLSTTTAEDAGSAAVQGAAV